VQGAAIVLGGEGVFIGAEVEEDLAIFEQSGLGVGVEKGLDRSSDFGRGLGLVRGRSSGRGHRTTVANAWASCEPGVVKPNRGTPGVVEVTSLFGRGAW